MVPRVLKKEFDCAEIFEGKYFYIDSVRAKTHYVFDLKGPTHEIFGSMFITSWVGDFRNRIKNKFISRILYIFGKNRIKRMFYVFST
jgi:hypothetical protein